MASYNTLTAAQAETFLTRGFVYLPGAVDPAVVQDWTSRVWTRLGYDPQDKTTWLQPRIHMPSHGSAEVSEIAPRAWEVICDLCGGAERVQPASRWGDGFIVNLGTDADAETWQPPSAQAPGWHKDGDWFRHFLDSPEQGLLTIVLWSDVVPRGGATFVAGDSVSQVARFLVEHPEGTTPNGFDFHAMAARCSDFFEATGKAGDVYLLHPYLLHASSQNALRLPRLITNPAISLREPMQFDRPSGDYSLVEQAILRGLGADKLAFAPTLPRERITPQRVVQQEKMKQEEAARLAAQT